MKDKLYYERLMKMSSKHILFNAEYRAFLDYVDKRWYVEAEATGQLGDVEKVIRDKYGIPVCLEVKCPNSSEKDYIPVDKVNFYEPWDKYVYSFEEYAGGDTYY